MHLKDHTQTSRRTPLLIHPLLVLDRRSQPGTSFFSGNVDPSPTHSSSSLSTVTFSSSLSGDSCRSSDYRAIQQQPGDRDIPPVTASLSSLSLAGANSHGSLLANVPNSSASRRIAHSQSLQNFASTREYSGFPRSSSSDDVSALSPPVPHGSVRDSLRLVNDNYPSVKPQPADSMQQGRDLPQNLNFSFAPRPQFPMQRCQTKSSDVGSVTSRQMGSSPAELPAGNANGVASHEGLCDAQ